MVAAAVPQTVAGDLDVGAELSTRKDSPRA
jgi:hypothetical protein